jgi:hypothetical protein
MMGGGSNTYGQQREGVEEGKGRPLTLASSSGSRNSSVSQPGPLLPPTEDTGTYLKSLRRCGEHSRQ